MDVRGVGDVLEECGVGVAGSWARSVFDGRYEDMWKIVYQSLDV